MGSILRIITEKVRIANMRIKLLKIQKILNLIIFIILFEVSCLRTIIKYVSNPLLSAFMIISYFLLLLLIIYLFQLRKSIIDHISKNKYLYVLSILSLAAIVLYGYPIADSLKLHGKGSDQDDCVILGVENLLKAQNPYSSRTYRNNPCSTGMGVLIAYIPFVYIGFYELGSVIFMIITIWYLYINRGPKLAFFLQNNPSNKYSLYRIDGGRI
jgi:hypothetical protein